VRVLDDDRDPRIDDLPVDADTHNDVDLFTAHQHQATPAGGARLAAARQPPGAATRTSAAVATIMASEWRTTAQSSRYWALACLLTDARG
jgi:hypothetical protein